MSMSFYESTSPERELAIAKNEIDKANGKLWNAQLLLGLSSGTPMEDNAQDIVEDAARAKEIAEFNLIAAREMARGSTAHRSDTSLDEVSV